MNTDVLEVLDHQGSSNNVKETINSTEIKKLKSQSKGKKNVEGHDESNVFQPFSVETKNFK